MLQLRGDFRFVEESPTRARVVGASVLHPLDSHIAMQFFIYGEMHFTKASFGMQSLERKAAIARTSGL
jgi:hypothetical protein